MPGKPTTTRVDWNAIQVRLAAAARGAEQQEELTQLFRERARALAQPPRQDGSTGTEHLRFLVADVAFGIRLSDVHSILAEPHVTRIPGAPGHLGHVAYCDGRVVPILDLGPLMGRSQLPTTEVLRRRILITHAGKRLIGMAVGAALEIVPVDETHLTPAPRGSWSHEVSHGVTDTLTTILDMPRLWDSAVQRLNPEENPR